MHCGLVYPQAGAMQLLWTATPILLAGEMGVVIQSSGGTNLGDVALERDRNNWRGQLSFLGDVRRAE